MSPDIAPRIDTWLARCADVERNPFDGMAEAGLLSPADSYAAIARMKAALVERTGLLGMAGVWGGPQTVARWFVAGFGDADQRAAWLNRAASVAISEPRVGAHPKHLTTRAEPDGDGFRITGEKVWVSNGPSADVFIVLAITSEQEGRKRYSALLVPREAEGVTLQDMPAFHALRPSRHCGLVLDGVRVPRSAVLGAEGTAYETMALPFRDVEDAVGTFGLLGAFRFLLKKLVVPSAGNEAAAELGALVALIAVFGDAAEAVVSALDAHRLESKAASLVGLRVLASDIVQRVRAQIDRQENRADPAIDEVLRDIDVTLAVARGPRLVRQMRLAAELA
jgi:acyl-CoA dehydrogenase